MSLVPRPVPRHPRIPALTMGRAVVVVPLTLIFPIFRNPKKTPDSVCDE